jgi:uncharacterized membrane protein HdeD (DUF308 family)
MAVVADQSATMAAGLKRQWWQLLLWGISAVVLGGYLLVQPGVTTVVFIQVMACFWLVGGAIDAVGSIIRRESGWGWRLALGLLSVVAGLAILGNPLWGALIVVGTQYYLLALAALVVGVVTMFGGLNGGFSWGDLILGLLQVLIGIFLLMNPVAGGAGMLMALGILGIGGGIFAIVAAFRVRAA